MKLYDITSDLLALNNLMDNMVDENGEPRSPTDEEFEVMKSWFDNSKEEFEGKVDNYCKFIKNLKLSATNAEMERKNYKGELDRLTKRAKAFENKSECIKNLLRWQMDRLQMNKLKTDLFSVGIQNTQMKIEGLEGADLSSVPEKYLKPRELNVTAIKQDIKDGILEVGIENELATKVYYVADKKVIPNVRAVQGTALMIR